MRAGAGAGAGAGAASVNPVGPGSAASASLKTSAELEAAVLSAAIRAAPIKGLPPKKMSAARSKNSMQVGLGSSACNIPSEGCLHVSAVSQMTAADVDGFSGGPKVAGELQFNGRYSTT